jgi:protein-S-isoprenylcysteine O-methyltransferase Ste14
MRMAVLVLATTVGLGLLLFPAAGDVGWGRGWLLVLVFLASNLIVVPYIWRVNPELLVARSTFRWAKTWDKILSGPLIVSVLSIPVVAALDDGRFHWSSLPWWISGVSYVVFLIAMGLLTWVGAVNKFAEPAVRIQTERGHKVIENGPYAVVRHPSYALAIPWFASTALCLGSLWALVPAAVAFLLLIVRAHWEDQTLQDELPGYKTYAARVRYKLIPGIW